MELPQSDLPNWVKTGATLLLGAGAARLLAVWLENRRLAHKEYRETLLSRIRELELIVTAMHGQMTDLKVSLALLKEENEELRERLGNKDSPDVQQPIQGKSDGSTSS